MSLEPDTVSKHLQMVLGLVETTAQSLDVELPGRRYITVGGAVYDCEQVSVSANAVSTGVVGDEEAGAAIANCAPTWQFGLDIALVRKQTALPEGRRGEGLPVTDLIVEDANQASKDVALLTAVAEALAGEELGAVQASILLGEAQGMLNVCVLTLGANLWIA